MAHMPDDSNQYQQNAYAMQAPSVVESASATTNAAANTSGNGIYLAFLVVVVLLCIVMTQAGGCAGQLLGETAGEYIEEHGDEFIDYDEYQELQDQLGEDDAFPDFSGLLEGASQDA